MDDAIGADSSDPEAYVAPLQGFFVEAKTAGTSISLNYKKEMMAANPVEVIKVGGEDNLPGNVPTNGPIGTIPDLFPLPSYLFPLPSYLLPLTSSSPARRRGIPWQGKASLGVYAEQLLS